MIKFILEPKLSLRPITFDVTGMDNTTKNMSADNLGFFPLVYYNGYQIYENDILYFSISNNSFMPTLLIEFTDRNHVIDDQGHPIDDTIISIYIKSSRPKVLMPIRLDFKISSFRPIMNENQTVTYTITGVINIDNLFLKEQRSFKNMNSFDVFKQLAQDFKLGFCSNIEFTDDKMNWINTNITWSEWIQQTCKQSYFKEEAFTWIYIDLYNNLTFIDLETQLRESSDTAKGIVNHGGHMKQILSNPPDEINNPEEIVLVNSPTAQDSENYFQDFSFNFKSTEVSLRNGYQKIVHMYDNRGNWDNNNKSGKFNTFSIDTITTPGNESSNIILKGSPNNIEFYKKHKTYEWLGKLERDNMHKNLNYIQVQNIQNIEELDKLSCTITLPNINMNLYRFQKIKVVFHNTNNTTPNGSFNQTLSGDWLIVGISYNYSADRAKTQTIKLIKRELGVATPILEAGQSQPQNSRR